MIPQRFLAAAALVLAFVQGAREEARDLAPRSDPATRSAIESALAAPDEAAQRAALDALRATRGAARERLVLELFVMLRAATDTRDAMAFGVLAAALPIPREDVLAALVPLLESEDAALRASVAGVLAEYEDKCDDRGASFTAYRALLASPPDGLVRHIVETDPAAALQALARAQVTESVQLRALLLDAHELGSALWKLDLSFVAPADLARAEPQALAALARFSRDARWWARLAATEAARAQPALRASVPLAELAADAHPLVRASASAALAAPR